MSLDLAFYWKLFLNRLPVMLLFVLVCSSLGVITALKLPETYSTSARLLVEDPQIPGSTIRTDATEQLDILQQKLLTRANLIDIANRFRVFEDINEMNPDAVFTQMRQATSVRRTAGRGRATLMTISFEGRSGRVVSNVVNEFVTLALDENTTSRLTRAENALDFYGQEVQRLNQELDQQSATIAQFRSENAAALPSEQGYRLNRISLLQERMSQLDREKEAANAQRADLVRIYESTGQLRSSSASDTRRTPEEIRLESAELELEQARVTYSDRHPRMVELRTRVERLQAALNSQIAANQDSGDEEQQARSTDTLLFQTTLADIDTRLEAIDTETGRIQQEIDALKQSNAQSAANGIALAGLERDYVNIQNRYNSALNSLNSAQMSERIESTAQGQRITVIENANVPQTPSGPNRPVIATMGGLIGLGLAMSYFVLLELLNRSIRRPQELHNRFNIVPIAVIPYMESKTQRFVRRMVRIVATLVILITVPLALWYVDSNFMPLELVVQKGLNRLGLG